MIDHLFEIGDNDSRRLMQYVLEHNIAANWIYKPGFVSFILQGIDEETASLIQLKFPIIGSRKLHLNTQ